MRYPTPELIIEPHTLDNSTFLTYINYIGVEYIVIVNMCLKKTVSVISLNSCGMCGIDANAVIASAQKWHDTKPELPFGIYLNSIGQKHTFKMLGRMFNYDGISRVVGRFPHKNKITTNNINRIRVRQ